MRVYTNRPHRPKDLPYRDAIRFLMQRCHLNWHKIDQLAPGLLKLYHEEQLQADCREIWVEARLWRRRILGR